MTLRKHLRPETYCKNLKSRIIAQKLVRKDDKELANAVDTIFKGIDIINSLDEGDDKVFGVSLDSVTILEEFSDMITPEVCMLDASDRSTYDVMYHETKDAGKVLTLIQFMEAQAYVRSAYKRDENDGVVSIAQLRKRVNLMDVIHKAIYTHSVMVDGVKKDSYFVNQPKGQSYYPMWISEAVIVSLFKDRHFGDPLEDMLDDLVLTKNFK